MTRLSSDSDSTSSSTDNDLVANGNILDDINTQLLERLLGDLQRGVVIGAIEPDSDQFSSSTEPSEEHSGAEREEENPIAIVQQQQQQRQAEAYYYQVHDSYQTDCYDSDEADQYESSPRPLEDSVYEFALSSARRLTADGCNHDDDYDLRPKFAILKHKTELLSGNSGDQRSAPRSYPKTPDWFFNIPDTRSPFPNFESNLKDE